MYYRVAIQVDALPTWQWKSTPLSSLTIVIRWLQYYQALSRDRLRIFSSCSREELNEQLVRENQGLGSSSVSAIQFLQERRIAPQKVKCEELTRETRANKRMPSIASVTESLPNENNRSPLDMRRDELERGAGGDHDLPYLFALPISIPQVLAWLKLQARVQQGDLQGGIVTCRNGELLWRNEENS